MLKGNCLLRFWPPQIKVGLILVYFPALSKMPSSVSIVLKHTRVPDNILGTLCALPLSSSVPSPLSCPTVELFNTCTDLELSGKGQLKKVSWSNFRDKSWSVLTVKMCFLQLLFADLFCGGNRNWFGRIPGIVMPSKWNCLLSICHSFWKSFKPIRIILLQHNHCFHIMDI